MTISTCTSTSPGHVLPSPQSSCVPEAKGVSSSAAVEVAAMGALCGALGVALEGRQLAILCQRVENLVVGAPCGIMDQVIHGLGIGRVMGAYRTSAWAHPGGRNFLCSPDKVITWQMHTPDAPHCHNGS